MRSFSRWLDRVFSSLNVSRYGYVVNKLLFRVAFLLMVVVVVVAGFVDGWSVVLFGGVYVECPVDAGVQGCADPFADRLSFEEAMARQGRMEGYHVPGVLVAGESVGVRPSLFLRLAPLFLVGLFFAALVLNHVLFNKGFFAARRGGGKGGFV